MNEQLDSVKRMNRLVMAHTCDQIRQKQLKERSQIKEEDRHFTIELDQMMEIERLKQVNKEQRLC